VLIKNYDYKTWGVNCKISYKTAKKSMNLLKPVTYFCPCLFQMVLRGAQFIFKGLNSAFYSMELKIAMLVKNSSNGIP